MQTGRATAAAEIASRKVCDRRNIFDSH